MGGGYSFANAINNKGQVLAQSLTGGGQVRAFLWDAIHGIQDIGLERATAINDNGQVVGDVNSQAIVWDSTRGLQGLGTLGGRQSYPVAINRNGQVSGISTIAGDNASHAFLWDSTHGMQDLGTLGGSLSSAWAINNVGEVVGWSYTTLNRAQHAFLVATVKSPAQQTAGLDTLLQGMSIDTGLKKSLSAKLQSALASINANNQTAACGALQAFINEVNAQTGKKLTAAQASQLNAAAQRIRDALGCR